MKGGGISLYFVIDPFGSSREPVCRFPGSPDPSQITGAAVGLSALCFQHFVLVGLEQRTSEEPRSEV